MNDLRYAFRSLLKSPGFAAVTVLTLALGLTVNTVFFTITNDLFLRPLPAEAPERLVVVAQKSPEVDYQLGLSYADVEDLRRMVESKDAAATDLAQVYSDLMAYNEEVVHLSGTGTPTERTWVHAVTDNYFSVLGVQPHLGRFFQPGEAKAPGADPFIVLTDDTWRIHFGSDPAIIGRAIRLNGLPFTVIGVAPKGFFGAAYGTAYCGFVPATMLTRLEPGGESYILKRGNSRFFLMGRLRPGASLAHAQAVTEVAYAQVIKANPGYYLNNTRAVVMKESNSRPTPYIAHYTPKIVAALSALGLLVLVIAIANVANLLYARASSRERELAIRAAVGASRFHLIRGLLVESALLALIAGVIGTIASLWLTPALVSLLPQSPGAPSADTGVDWRPIVVTGVASLLVGVAAGMLPALKASGAAPLPFLKDASPLSDGRRHLLRSLLVVGQIAVSCIVLVCAALALRSMLLLSRIDLGFKAENLVVASFDLGPQNYDADHGRAFHLRLLEQVRTLPGVTAASLATSVPMDTRMALNGGIVADGEPLPPGYQPPPVACVQVESTYLSTLGLRLEAGRDFTAHDKFGSPRVVIINRALANQLWPGKDPVGRKLSFQGDHGLEVVGVVGRSCYSSLTDDTRPLLIGSLSQDYRGGATLIVRVASAVEPLTSAITKIVHGLDPDLPLYGVQTLRQQIKDSPNGLMSYRMGAIMAGVQGVIALLLATAGIFGLISFAVARRTREIGIRMALGASRLEVVRAVTRESVVLTSIGLAAGLLLSFGLSRQLANLLFRAGTYDALILGGVALLILLAALLACWLPARRATKVDPMVALRTE